MGNTQSPLLPEDLPAVRDDLNTLERHKASLRAGTGELAQYPSIHALRERLPSELYSAEQRHSLEERAIGSGGAGTRPRPRLARTAGHQ